MSHTASPAPRTKWQRWLLAGLIAGTLILGFWGNCRHAQESPHQHSTGHDPASPPAPNLWSVGYHTLQFLLLHGTHLAEPVPWQLQWGRWLGACFLFVLGVAAFVKFFRDEILFYCLRRPWLRFRWLRLRWLRLPWLHSWLHSWLHFWKRKHVVICGLGDLGMRLAIDARKDTFVVAIEKQKSTAIELARDLGILVIEGDACEVEILKRAALDQCESLFVACPDDATNAAIATRAGGLIPREPRLDSPVICRLLVHEAEMRHLLKREKVFEWGSGAAGPHPNYRVHFNDLDLPDTAVRQALRMFPLDIQPILRDSDETRVHVVVVGGGPIGYAMVVHAARFGHFANETPARRIRITLVDAEATARVEKFKKRWDKWEEFCELIALDLDHSSPDFIARLKEYLQPVSPGDPDGPDELQTVVLCLETAESVPEYVTSENDDKNWRLGLELTNLTNQGRRQLLTYQSTRNGFAALLSTNTTENPRRLHPFGMIEDLHSQSVLLKESEYQLARAIHERYVKHHGGDSWESLSEDIQESNRHAADHALVKLRALGYHQAPLKPDQSRIESFSDPEKLLVAKMEHKRWCAERWLADWKYGPQTIKEKKIHKDLVPWEELPEKEQRKDFEQIEALPEILFAIGRGIYR